MAARTPFVAGNWKMNLSLNEASALAEHVRAESKRRSGIDVGLFPSFPFVAAVAEICHTSDVFVGGQTLHPEASGAHTGETSGEQLVSAGATHVLIGHSERRQAGETDADVADRVRAALRAHLVPVICVGETLAEREAEQTEAVITRQLTAALEALGGEPPQFVIAYEPVWAIGTGKTATVEQAGAAHGVLRGVMTEVCGGERAALTRILYGGSVKPANAAELCAHPDIDGALVGGASLDAESFGAIMEAAAAAAAGS
ncbi:MAG: triose-phosphate isomerase [Planctomycetota bacterium]|jgi:triosephosphate isomerase